ncbi:uncharacterized protein [Epargyreus clarus]|uniref:uncharacterized protein n=1 Tax=Epargyreus clarus TaxID=520877 RepID=UPI003C2AAD9F
MNELDLIKEVEKHPILYDKNVKGFNKAKLRDDAWKEVAKVLDVTDTECKKRWRSLRDSFIKLQRTHGNRTRWPYHHAMRFLIPHLEPRPDFPKKDDDDTDSDGSRKRVTAKRKQYDEDEDEDDEDSPAAKQARQSSTDDENPCHCSRNDTDELFLLSCAPILKRLNKKQSAVARLKIQQVLLEAEFGNTPHNNMPSVSPTSDLDGDHVI